jgi:hypothetical protein
VQAPTALDQSHTFAGAVVRAEQHNNDAARDGDLLSVAFDGFGRTVRGEAILGAMPAEARAGFEEFGRPAYAAYAARLADY